MSETVETSGPAQTILPRGERLLSYDKGEERIVTKWTIRSLAKITNETYGRLDENDKEQLNELRAKYGDEI